MHNHAPIKLTLTLGVLMFGSGCANAGYQEVRALGAFDRSTITAVGTMGNSFVLSSAPGASWTGTFTSASEQMVVTEETCAPFRDAIAILKALPALRPGPLAAQNQSGPMPIPPTTKDGEGWTITTVGFAPDWSESLLTIQGDQGPYAAWASDTVRSVETCS